MKKINKKIAAEEFDKRFDNGEDMGHFLDVKKAKVNKQFHRINIDFPLLLLEEIGKEAKKIGVARTALIKIWLAERLEHIHH